jgi:predicted aspartyl protease
VATLPLEARNDGLVTRVRLNGTEMNMLVDTGAQLTIIRAAAAKRLKLEGTRLPIILTGIGGERYVDGFRAKTFEIGKLHGQNLTMMVADVADLASDQTDGNSIDGILGMDFLAQYDIDLDLPENKIRLFKPIRGCHSARAALEEPLYTQPMYWQGVALVASAVVPVGIGGRHLLALIDSGATSTAIYRNVKYRAGLTTADLARDPRSYTRGVGPRKVATVEHRVAALTIGDITIQHLPITVMDERSDDQADMLLGRDFLSRVHVWLSFSSRTVVMQLPPRPSPPDPP